MAPSSLIRRSQQPNCFAIKTQGVTGSTLYPMPRGCSSTSGSLQIPPAQDRQPQSRLSGLRGMRKSFLG